MLQDKIKELRELVWGMDIPSPGCPEYVELHNKMQEILKFIDKELLVDTKVNLCDDCVYSFIECMNDKAFRLGDDFKFGNGLGNDNIWKCNRYIKEGNYKDCDCCDEDCADCAKLLRQVAVVTHG